MTEQSPTAENTETPMTWVVAMLFWLQLVIAALLYAAVALSPKLSIYSKLHIESVRTKAQLVHLEAQVNELKKVVHYLETDPTVIQELARIDLDAARPDEERIPLDEELMIQSRLTSPAEFDASVSRSWVTPFLAAFSENQRLRSTCLILSAVLVLISFTFFHPSQANRFSLRVRQTNGTSRSWFSRYRRE